MAQADSDTQSTDSFPTTVAGRALRVLLTGHRSPVSGLAAMDPQQFRGRRAGALPWLSQGISPSSTLPLSPGCLLAASLPVPGAQALTFGQRVEDLSRVLIAPTSDKHH